MLTDHLKHIETIPTPTNGTYYYYRKNANLPRVRLPDPNETPSEDFLEAYIKAKAYVDDFRHCNGLVKKSVMLRTAFNAYLKAIKPKVSANTYHQYKRFAARICAHFGKVPLKTITHDDFDKFILAEESAQAANCMLSFAQRAWAWFMDHKLLPDSPISEVRPREFSSDGHEPWTEEDVQQFKRRWAPGSWPYTVLEVILYTGCRISDALDLGPKNIAGDTLFYKSKKTSTVVSLHISDEFRGKMAHVFREKKYFIHNPRTRKRFNNYGTFWRLWKRSCMEAGIDKNIHGLRKTVAVRLANDGHSAAEIMSMLGWRSLGAAEIYVKTADREKLGISTSYQYQEKS